MTYLQSRTQITTPTTDLDIISNPEHCAPELFKVVDDIIQRSSSQQVIDSQTAGLSDSPLIVGQILEQVF